MWNPKTTNYNIHCGKMARIHYKNKKKQYVEGKLIRIMESDDKVKEHTVQILSSNNCTIYSCTSTIIEMVCVEANDIINDEVSELCFQHMVEDIGPLINEYVEHFIEI